MALTGNPLLKLLVIPVVIGAILIGVSMMGKRKARSHKVPQPRR